jgi:hypothetical protein
VRSLRELGDRLGRHFRFRRFRIVRRGRWFQLLGYFNPWIVLADGTLEWVDEVERNVSRPGRTARIGDRVVARRASGDTVEGVVAGGSRSRPDYRSIADVAAGERISIANVIHHSVEQQIRRRFAWMFTVDEIHAPHMLRAIQRGVFNSAVHLSNIRRMWDILYRRLTPEVARIGRGAARRVVLEFRDFVDDYIEYMTRYARTNRRFIRAVESGDTDLARRLLDQRSETWWRVARPEEFVERILQGNL